MPLKTVLRLAPIAGLLWFAASSSAAPVLRVLKSGSESTERTTLVRNGRFEEVAGALAIQWRPWHRGYTVAAAAGIGNSGALSCENTTVATETGGSQTVLLNQSNAAPIIVRGWSKAENVSGAPDSGYSIYVDLVHADGSPLWGQTGNFRCGTHGWQMREFVIIPSRPVKSLTVYCLFRGHTGRAWFDDVSIEEIRVTGNSVVFQGVPVESGTAIPEGRNLSAVKPMAVIDGRSLATNGGAFWVRDVANNSDFVSFEDGKSAELGLHLQSEFISRTNHVLVRGRLTDTRAMDRAVTLVFALPMDAAGWKWGDDIRRERTIEGAGEFANVVSIRAGSTGTQSLYPIGAVWNANHGSAIGINMARPAVYRVGYHAGLKQLFVAYDFGLSAETASFPSAAEFEFVVFHFDQRHGFRGAWQKFTEIFSEHFVARTREQGLWMPFTDVSKVPGWQDFGFKFHEGNNSVPWDDQNGILSFRYTEPMTWWMRMAKDVPRTLPSAMKVRDDLASGKDGRARFAQAARAAAMHTDSGEPALQFQDTPWCNGAVWSLNPNPWLGSTGTLNAATIHWSDSIKDKLYGPTSTGRLDGEYLDSLEGYVTADLNFRREHFRTTTVPLTFSAETKALALFKGLAVFEFTKWMADDVHRMGKLMFANGVPYRFTYLCPWLDVLGTETDWLRAGKYQPAAITQMDLWRTLSGVKPYLLLMNTDYDQFTPKFVEKYFDRCLFYGMWPGFFSHNASENPYWLNTRWIERDRPMFRKYIPIIRRVAHAGWRPVTGAVVDNRNVLIERFGPGADQTVILTFFNDTSEPQEGTVTLDAELTPFAMSSTTLLGETRPLKQNTFTVRLPPQRVAVVAFSPNR